jgi:murein DD-endopeptidase MepM/ murein hydrolase activator NlpD
MPPSPVTPPTPDALGSHVDPTTVTVVFGRRSVRRAVLAAPMLVLAQCGPTCAPPPVPVHVDIPALGADTTPYRVPVADVGRASWGTTHSSYPATDIFVRCGATIVSPVDGVVLEARRHDAWVPAVDNPATRGGRSVAIVGDDGVRYYLAHFDRIEAGIERGARVTAGQSLGTMGRTGRASACHAHFGISPPCPGPEWSVRRGVVWPFAYLDDWRNGGQRSPVAEVQQWVAANPDGCAQAMADPFAADS